MTASLPLWTLPFVLALLGLALALGHFSIVVSAVAGAATLVAVGASLALVRGPAKARRPVANLLALLPGHLLLLFGIGTLPHPDTLGLVWCVVPTGSAIYHWATARDRLAGRTSILAGLYAIIWLAVLFLVEEFIATGKGLTGRARIATAVVTGAIGAVFLVTGTIRHRRAVKE